MVGAWQSNAINSGWQGQINWAPDMNNGYSHWATNNVMSGRESVNGVSIGTFSPYSVNFGNNMSSIWQNINVKNALNSTQTGLQVNGFSYSMYWKNGNNWDNAMTDQLYTFVNVIDANNRTIDSKTYNLSYNTGQRWWQSSWTDTFKTPYAADQLKIIQFGFTGKDNNGNWFGYYGPEITNINFRLNYSIDPCVANPLAHSNCSGYSAALAKLSSPVKSATTTAGVPAVISSITNTGTSGVRDATNTNYSGVNIGAGTLNSGVLKINDGLPVSVSDSIKPYGSTTQLPQTSTLSSVLSPTGTKATDTQTTVSSSTASTTVQQSQQSGTSSGGATTSTANNTTVGQTLPGVTTVSTRTTATQQSSYSLSTQVNTGNTTQNSTSISSGSLAPSILQNPFNQSASSNASAQQSTGTTTQSVTGNNSGMNSGAFSAMSNASMGTTTEQQSTQSYNNSMGQVSVSSASSQQSQGAPTSQSETSTGTGLVLVRPIDAFRVELVKQGGSGDGIAVFVPPTSFSMPTESSQSNPMTASYGFSNNPVSVSSRSEMIEQMSVQQVQQEQPQQQQIAMYQPVKAQSMTESRPVEVQQQSTSTAVSAVSALGSKTNPVSEATGPKKEVETTTEVKVEVATTVKANVAPNELAGGIDTASLTPGAPSLDRYINASLVDAPFYKVDAIYKNQFVVDNARAQRLLGRGSELKWQQMVDSQYKIGE